MTEQEAQQEVEDEVMHDEEYLPPLDPEKIVVVRVSYSNALSSIYKTWIINNHH